MPARLGTAYVHILGDFAPLNAQLRSQGGILSRKSAQIGKTVAAGIGVGAAGAGAALFAIGESFDKAFDKIRVDTGATGDRLQGLERDFKEVVKDVPATFEQASAALAGLAQRLGISGRPLRKLTKQVLELSRLTGTDIEENVSSVTRLFEDWDVASKDQSESLDGLFRASQKTGVGVGDLSRLMVKFGAPLRSLGFNFDEAAAMFAKFEREGVNIQTTLPGLRLGLANIAAPTGEAAEALKELGVTSREPKEGLRQVFEALRDAPAKTNPAIKAMQIFGKRAGSDLAEAVRQGRFSYQDLVKTVDGGNESILKASKDTQDFSETWQKFKNNVLVGLEPVATKVFSGISDEVKALTDILTDKKLTSEEKFSKIMDRLEAGLERGLPKIVEIGAKIAEALIRGIARAFIHGSPLVKLFTAAALIRLFGGKGALTRSGVAIGRALGIGVAAGTTQTASRATLVPPIGGGAGGRGGGRGRAVPQVIPRVVRDPFGREIKTTGGQRQVREIPAPGFRSGAPVSQLGRRGGILGGIRGQTQRITPQVREIGKGVLGVALMAGIADAATRPGLDSFGARLQQAFSDTTIGLIPPPKTISEKLNKGFREALQGVDPAKALKPGKGLFQTSLLDLVGVTDDSGLNDAEKKLIGKMVGIRKRAAALFGKGVKLKLNVATPEGERAFNKLEVGFNRLKNRLAGDAAGIVRVANQNLKLLPQIMNLHSRKGREAIVRNMRLASSAIVSSMRTGASSANAGMRAIRASFVSNSKASKETTVTNFGLAKTAIRDAVRAGVISARRGTREINRLFKQYLSAFGIKGHDQELYLQGADPHGGTEGARGRRQRGGLITVPGHGTGDTVRATVPVGTGVINRKAARVLLEPGEKLLPPHVVKRIGGPKVVDRINRAIPRFQEGGVVGRFLHGGTVSPQTVNTGGLKPGIAALVRRLVSQFPGLAVTSTTGGGHAAGSYHYQGLAADLASGDYGYMNRAAKWVKRYTRSLTEGIHNPNLSVKFGKRVSPSFWGASTWAGHLNHIHLAVAGALQAAARGGGGGAARAIEQIARLKVGGPDSPVKAGIQAGLDRLRETTNQRLREVAALVSESGGGDTGSVRLPRGSGSRANRLFGKRMARRYGWTGAEFAALDDLWGRLEGSWDENVANYAGSGAYGIAQALPASKYPPAGQPGAPPGIRKAQAQIGWGLRYIKGRYGDPSSAHAFRLANNYYAEGGIVEALKGGFERLTSTDRVRFDRDRSFARGGMVDRRLVERLLRDRQRLVGGGDSRFEKDRLDKARTVERLVDRRFASSGTDGRSVVERLVERLTTDRRESAPTHLVDRLTERVGGTRLEKHGLVDRLVERFTKAGSSVETHDVRSVAGRLVERLTTDRVMGRHSAPTHLLERIKDRLPGGLVDRRSLERLVGFDRSRLVERLTSRFGRENGQTTDRDAMSHVAERLLAERDRSVHVGSTVERLVAHLRDGGASEHLKTHDARIDLRDRATEGGQQLLSRDATESLQSSEVSQLVRGGLIRDRFRKGGTVSFDRQTRRFAKIIASVGKTSGAPTKIIQAALAASMTETGGPGRDPGIIRNPAGGDASSVGLFQMLADKGSVRQRHDPRFAARWFFKTAKQAKLKGQPVAAIAQAVERSAFPGRYAQYVDDAQGLLAQVTRARFKGRKDAKRPEKLKRLATGGLVERIGKRLAESVPTQLGGRDAILAGGANATKTGLARVHATRLRDRTQHWTTEKFATSELVRKVLQMGGMAEGGRRKRKKTWDWGKHIYSEEGPKRLGGMVKALRLGGMAEDGQRKRRKPWEWGKHIYSEEAAKQTGGMVERMRRGGQLRFAQRGFIDPADVQVLLRGGGPVEAFQPGGVPFGTRKKKRRKPDPKKKGRTGRRGVDQLFPAVPGLDLPTPGDPGNVARTGPLPRAFRRTLKRITRRPKKRQKTIDQFLRRLEKLGIPKTLTRQWKRHRDAAATYDDFAVRAGELSDYEPETGPPVIAQIGGKPEVRWLLQELDSLFRERNVLVRTRKITVRRRDQVARALKLAKARLHKLGERSRTPKKWKGVNPATGKVATWNKQTQAVRHKKMRQWQRGHGRLPGDREFKPDGRLTVVGAGQRAALPKFIKAMGKQREGLTGGLTTILEELSAVQGKPAPGISKGVLKTLPPLGGLGGQIYEVQKSLKEFLTRQAKVTDTATDTAADERASARADILAQMLREANLRTEVLRRQFDVLKDFPRVGSQTGFREGGTVPGIKVGGTGSGDKVALRALVEPGERVFVLNRNASRELETLRDLNIRFPRFQTGGELGTSQIALARGGSIVAPATDTNGDTAVHLHFKPGTEWLHDFVKVELERGTRRQARTGQRVLPGRTGS